MYLILWQWTKDPRKFRLHNAAAPLFPTSPSFADQWRPVATFDALNPLTRPIPTGSQLYVAAHQPAFPYNTTSIALASNLFYPQERGLYFIADDAVIAGLKSNGLPIR